MKGWQIFLHSLKQVTGNLSGAIKVSAVPYLILIGVVGLVFGLDTSEFDPEMIMQGGGPGGGLLLGGLLALILYVFVSLWVAVAWHRLVLLGEEASGYLPVLKTDRIWAYFVRSVGILLVLFAAMFPLSLIGGLVAAPFVASFSADTAGAPAFTTAMIPFFVIMTVLVYLPLIVLSFRISAALPGAALGSEVTFFAGWHATKGANIDILVLAICVLIASVVLEVLSWFPVVGVVIQLLGTWLMIMVGASILTTLYGHYIEGRSLAGIQEQPNPFE